MELQLKVNSFKLNNLVTLFLYVTCLNIILSPTCLANNVYTCKDINGNVLYTDSTEKAADCVTEPTAKTIKPLPSFKPGTLPTANQDIENPAPSKDATGAAAEAEYNSITITSPQSGEAVNRCGGTLDVNFTPDPALFEGDTARLYIDGTESTTSSGPSFTVTELNRGSHSLTVKIYRNDILVGSSETVNFTFLRNCANRS